MKKITNQNWHGSIDNRYNDYLLDKKGIASGFYNYRSKNDLPEYSFVKNECYYGILRIFKFQNSCNKFLNSIIDFDLRLIKNTNNLLFRIFRVILNLIIIFLSMIVIIENLLTVFKIANGMTVLHYFQKSVL